jgi:hypothetical protein
LFTISSVEEGDDGMMLDNDTAQEDIENSNRFRTNNIGSLQNMSLQILLNNFHVIDSTKFKALSK